MQKVGKDFMIVKVLLPGVYRYQYFVDEQMRYSPDSPWEYDVSGNAYNILDVEVIEIISCYSFIMKLFNCSSFFSLSCHHSPTFPQGSCLL